MTNAAALLLTAALAGVGGWYCGALEPRSQKLRPAPPDKTAKAVKLSALPPLKVSSLDGVDVQERLETLLASPGHSSVELRLLMVHWVATDLAAAKKWTLELPRGTGGLQDPHERMLTEFFTAWARLDPLAAATEAAALNPNRAFSARRAVVAGLAEADVATISKVLEKLPARRSDLEPYGVHALVRQLAARDSATAQALALSLKGAAGDAAAKAVAEVLARTDPHSALTWSQQHPLAAARAGAAEAVLKEWARRDPDAVGPLLFQKSDGKPDQFLAGAAVVALRQLSARSPAEAAAFVEKFIPPEQVKTHLSSLYDLLGSDPDAPGVAAALCSCVGRLSPEELKNAKLFSRGWPGYEGMKPAWDRLLLEPDNPARRFLLGQMGQPLIAQRPAAVMQELMKLPEPALREELLAAALNGTGNFETAGHADFPAVIAELRSVVASLPESLRARGTLRLAWAVAESDPHAAAEIIREYPVVTENTQFMRHLSGQFIRATEPDEAQRWADSLPNETGKANAYAGITGAWYEQDSEAASRWVNTLPPGTARDAAAEQFAHTGTRNSEPDTAMAWAASVQDPARRAAATADVVRYWARFNPALAENTVTGSTLSEAEKAGLLRILNQTR